MRELVIKGQTGSSRIRLGEELQNLQQYLPDTNAVIITDTNVRRLYGDRFPPLSVIEIGLGEEIKTLATLEGVYMEMLACDLDRSSFVVGIGGGIVLDVAGFAASTFMRGVPFGFVATTLLAQVDASLGGKNGVNFQGLKNMVGVFNQPEFVICDLRMLRTLPERDYRCGFGEIIKHAAIRSPELFDALEASAEELLAGDREVLEELVHQSLQIKAAVVNQDERERGLRKILNFGHTFAHGIEANCGLPHGEAVCVGMNVAAGISVARGLLEPAARERLESLCVRLQMPTALQIDYSELLTALRKDKKKAGNRIDFILLREIGDAVIVPLEFSELEALIDEM